MKLTFKAFFKEVPYTFFGRSKYLRVSSQSGYQKTIPLLFAFLTLISLWINNLGIQ